MEICNISKYNFPLPRSFYHMVNEIKNYNSEYLQISLTYIEKVIY